MKKSKHHRRLLLLSLIESKWRISLLATIILTLLHSSAHADWPLVRGDTQASGTASCTLPANPQVVWKFSRPEAGFEATALLVNGILYVGDTEGTFYAFHLSDGKLAWAKSFKESGFLAGAAYANKCLIVCDLYGVVRCLASDTGELLWKQETDAEIYAAPNVIEDQVLVTTESGDLLTFQFDTGEPSWKFHIEAPLRCWPAVAKGRVLLAGCDERLHAVDSTTGQESGGIDIEGPTGCTPALLGDHVYFGTELGIFYAMHASTMQMDWQFHDPKRSHPIRTAAAINEHIVVFGSQGKQVYALHPDSGKLLWQFAARSRVESSPVIVTDRAWVATRRGRLHALDLKTGKSVWQYDAGGGFIASPAVADQRLVIGNEDGTLYCFGNENDQSQQP
jgi:outer membrane protein assembly factor BamB